MELEEKWIIEAKETKKRFIECKFSVFIKFFFNELSTDTQNKLISFIEGNSIKNFYFNQYSLIPIYLLRSTQNFKNEDVFKIMNSINCTDMNSFFFLYSVLYFCYYNFSLEKSIELAINLCQKCDKLTYNTMDFDISFLQKNKMPESLPNKVLWLSTKVENIQISNLIDTPKEIIALAKYLNGLINNRKRVDFDIDEKYEKTLLKFKMDLIQQKLLL